MVVSTGNDSFSIQEVKCPSCGGPLELPANADVLTCQFCGSTIHVSYGESSGQGGNEQSGIEPDGTIRDRGTGYGLFRARVADGWKVVGTALQGTGSSSRPHIPQVQLRNSAGQIISLAMGDAGTRRSAGFAAISGMYTGHLAGVDHANYAEVPDPLALADAVAAGAAASIGASIISFSRQLTCPDLESKKQRSFARFQRIAQAQGAMVANPFMGIVLRVYDCSVNGKPWNVASYVALSATKDGMGLGGLSGVADGMSGLMEGIGSLFGGQKTRSAQPSQMDVSTQSTPQSAQGGSAMDFFLGGGLIGKMRRDRMAEQESQISQAAQPQTTLPNQETIPQQAAPSETQHSESSASWSSPDYAEYVAGGTIYWGVDAVVTFVSPASDFDEQLKAMFLPLVDSLETHPDVETLALQVAMQEAGQMGQATHTQLAQNQAAFQAQQAAHRQQQAAFNSYNQSISDARNAHHQQFMASSHAQMNHSAPDFSEAIRGVNTYTTSDGREVELSVHADRAYENQAGDVIGASGAFDPGASWTEIPRT